MIFCLNRSYFHESVYRWMLVRVKCCDLFEVWTKFLNNILTSFGFKGFEMQVDGHSFQNNKFRTSFLLGRYYNCGNFTLS
jgi:hypothetical protein